jgi:hypothetical protein
MAQGSPFGTVAGGTLLENYFQPYQPEQSKMPGTPTNQGYATAGTMIGGGTLLETYLGTPAGGGGLPVPYPGSGQGGIGTQSFPQGGVGGMSWTTIALLAAAGVGLWLLLRPSYSRR